MFWNVLSDLKPPSSIGTSRSISHKKRAACSQLKELGACSVYGGSAAIMESKFKDTLKLRIPAFCRSEVKEI